MTPDLDGLLSDIKSARQQRGMNAWWQDVLQRAHRAIGDLREISAVNKSGCDRALDMLEVSAATCKALATEVERLKAERLKLDKRIHNQRVALRQTWEIVEMRRKWLGSDIARKKYHCLLEQYRALQAKVA